MALLQVVLEMFFGFFFQFDHQDAGHLLTHLDREMAEIRNLARGYVPLSPTLTSFCRLIRNKRRT